MLVFICEKWYLCKNSLSLRKR